jgi:IS4 transposase
MDSTSIDLCASLFDWSRYKRTKGAAKVHLLLDHNGYLPSFACVTDGKTSDIEVARQFQFAPGTVVVMDRAYVDYEWWERLSKQGVFFVTRFKSDLRYEVVEQRTVPPHRNIRADQVVRLRATTKAGGHQTLYRRIVLWVEDRQEEMAFFTNHLEWGATTVTSVYKDRWQIESFFKSLKQLLRVKTFVGTSPNALKTQIWTALIAMLLLKYLQLRSRFGWSLSNLCALLRQQLFVYRDLFGWLDDPYQPPPALAGWHDLQLTLDWRAA